MSGSDKMELDQWIQKFTHNHGYPIVRWIVPPNKLPDPDKILTPDDLVNHHGITEPSSGKEATNDSPPVEFAK